MTDYPQDIAALFFAVYFATWFTIAMCNLAHTARVARRERRIARLLPAEPDSAGPLGHCRYNCDESEHVGDHKHVCLYREHWA